MHAVIVLAQDAQSVEAHRNHPDHVIVAHQIELMEEKGIGVDFEDKALWLHSLIANIFIKHPSD